MPRPPRHFEPEGYYHLVARGNNGRPIFLDDTDRREFLRVLAIVLRRFRLRLVAWCLLGNHYHLLVQTPDGRVSPAMQFLNGQYALRFNQRHGRTGHLFRARFRATLVLDEGHLERTTTYIVFNAVRAGLAAAPPAWRWCGLDRSVVRAP